MGFGQARAFAAVTNVLAGAFPIGWVGLPAQQFVAPSKDQPIVPAWKSSTTVWSFCPCQCESDAGAYIVQAITS